MKLRKLISIFVLVLLSSSMYAQLNAYPRLYSGGYNFYVYMDKAALMAKYDGVQMPDSTAIADSTAITDSLGLSVMDTIVVKKIVTAWDSIMVVDSTLNAETRVGADSIAAMDSTLADSVKEGSGKYPLILYLHGKSLSGTYLARVRKYGTLHAIEMGLKVDAIVVAPQSPGETWNMQKLNDIIDFTIANYPVDTTRIYVLGMSMGGFGTFDYCAKFPDRVAAGIAICGGGHYAQECGLNKMPFWIIHGTADNVVPVVRSRQVKAIMERCGSTERLIYTELPGFGHSELARVFYLAKVYDWLFSHSLTDNGRPVNRNYNIVGDDIAHGNAYKGLRNGKVQLTVTNHGGNSYLTSPEPKTEKKDTTSTQQKSASAKSSGKVHTVKSGDTLSAIARKYGTTVDAICKLNGIKSTSLLQLNQKIKIPAK